MYKSFSIHHFRCFSEFSIADLARVNVLIGRNNVGKTAFLEAVFLHVGPYNPTLTINLSAFRGITSGRVNADALWGSLFYDHDASEPIRLVAHYSDRSKATLTISLVAPPVVPLAQLGFRPPDDESTKGEVAPLMDKAVRYKYSHRSTTSTRTLSITPDGPKVTPAISANPQLGFFIPSRVHLNPPSYAERFGQLLLNKAEAPVIEALRLLEPKLRALSVVPVPMPMIHADVGASRLLPLQLTGEGMVRVAEIAIDIASAPNGVVLVDDIDTGIHHSLLPQFWRVVTKLAHQLNVQIFATTHSAECISAIHEATSSNGKYDARIHRLQRQDGLISVVTYSKNLLQAAIDAGLEVR